MRICNYSFYEIVPQSLSNQGTKKTIILTNVPVTTFYLNIKYGGLDLRELKFLKVFMTNSLHFSKKGHTSYVDFASSNKHPTSLLFGPSLVYGEQRQQ